MLINDTVILQAWEHGKALGQLDLYIDDKKVVSVDSSLIDIRPTGDIPNDAISALVGKYTKKVDDVLDERIGETLTDLDGENVRGRETNLGDLIADIMKKTAMADAAIIGGGSIRTSIKKVRSG